MNDVLLHSTAVDLPAPLYLHLFIRSPGCVCEAVRNRRGATSTTQPRARRRQSYLIGGRGARGHFSLLGTKPEIGDTACMGRQSSTVLSIDRLISRSNDVDLSAINLFVISMSMCTSEPQLVSSTSSESSSCV